MNLDPNPLVDIHGVLSSIYVYEHLCCVPDRNFKFDEVLKRDLEIYTLLSLISFFGVYVVIMNRRTVD